MADLKRRPRAGALRLRPSGLAQRARWVLQLTRLYWLVDGRKVGSRARDL